MIFTNLRLRIAVKKGNLEAVTQALHAGADPESKGTQGYTPLMIAAENGHSDILRALVIAGADPNRTSTVANPGTAGVTALMAASNGVNSTGRVEPVQTLLELGSKPGLRDSHGRTALDYASISDSVEIATLLLSLDAS